MKKSKKHSSKSAKLFYSAFMAYPILHFIIFYLGVNLNSIGLAFRVENSSGIAKFSFENFSNFFADMIVFEELGVTIINSVVLWLCGLIIGVSLGLLFSFYIYKKFRFSGFFKVLLFLPSIISSIAMALMFMIFTDLALPELINAILGSEKVGGFLELGTKTVFPTIIFYNIWISFGVAVLMYSSAMSKIPEQIVEYASLEGISYSREFFTITIPLIGPTIESFILIGLAGLFTNQANILAFFPHTEIREIQTIGFYLFSQVSRGYISKYPYLSAGGLILTAIAVPVTLCVKKLMERVFPAVEY